MESETVGVGDVKVDKAKFDTLLRAMLSTPPLPRTEVVTRKSKAKKRRP